MEANQFQIQQMTQGAINSNQPPPRNQPDPSQVDESLLDYDTLEKIKILEKAKQKAAANEDFDEAMAIKSIIERIRSVGIHIQELDERKRLAIQNEDYDSAKIIKQEITKLKDSAFPPGLMAKYLDQGTQEQNFNQGYQ
jgi:centrosomal protein CEP104